MSPIPVSALMCHAPIVVPGVGGPGEQLVTSTTRAMREVAEHIVASAPDAIALIAPQAPRDRLRWSVGVDEVVGGDFAGLGAAAVRATAPGCPERARSLYEALAQEGLRSRLARFGAADPSTLVPLTFLAEAGWQGPLLVLAAPTAVMPGECAIAGQAIARAAAALGERWAVIASGDMSHRLAPGAPAGFDPDASRFDDLVVRAVGLGDYRVAADAPERLRRIAAEDALDSLTVAAAASAWDSEQHCTLSYERPFGVGYLVAILHEHPPDESHLENSQLSVSRRFAQFMYGIARSAIRAHLAGRPCVFPRADAAPGMPSGLFVSLRTGDGELRGCAGRVHLIDDLPTALAAAAVAAATADPRFEPVTLAELPTLRVDIALFGTLEPAELEQLDPTRYGVIVSQGGRRGVALPGLDGGSGPAQQVALAARKGYVDLAKPYAIHRFEVLRFSEPAAAAPDALDAQA